MRSSEIEAASSAIWSRRRATSAWRSPCSARSLCTLVLSASIWTVHSLFSAWSSSITVSKSSCFAWRSEIKVASDDIWSRKPSASFFRLEISSRDSCSSLWSLSHLAWRSATLPWRLSPFFLSSRRSSSRVTICRFRVSSFFDKLDWARSRATFKPWIWLAYSALSAWSSATTVSNSFSFVRSSEIEAASSAIWSLRSSTSAWSLLVMLIKSSCFTFRSEMTKASLETCSRSSVVPEVSVEISSLISCSVLW